MSDDHDQERKKKSSRYDPSRRKFLKGVGVAGAGAALADHLLAGDSDKVAALRRDVDAWYVRYHTIMDRALPNPRWGLGRLDAVGMIFNRVTGLGVGPEPSFLIPENIHKADAPVRYPFLWNAPKQDKTQWPGFADNGSDILALGRNVGEVLGVFARLLFALFAAQLVTEKTACRCT